MIYPPNKPINSSNVEKMLQFADEYQMNELMRRCRQFLITQRGFFYYLTRILIYFINFTNRLIRDFVDCSTISI